MNILVHSMNEQVHSMNIKCSYYDSFLFIVCFTTSYYVHCTSYYDSICPSLAPSALALPSAQVPEVARTLDSTNKHSHSLRITANCISPGSEHINHSLDHSGTLQQRQRRRQVTCTLLPLFALARRPRLTFTDVVFRRRPFPANRHLDCLTCVRVES
jgi:hypothetical protein